MGERRADHDEGEGRAGRRERLVAAMVAVHKHTNGLDLSGGRGAIDWHQRLADGGGRRFELYAGVGESVHLDLSFDELLELHAQLTLTLLEDLGWSLPRGPG